ncbi:hypothetical protein CcaverHIS002_0108420 [Cutaneotrichosporon cavernicola]|uniref:AB hydrolase-1 domain-containing protein n=1 Tax=Cutaneotrichosporon cavernicola TaxID=279322 RepID=A0AA48L0X7_9TREE|nr:uncharacterized protein CcaverHIS019_0108350 [Cutaneotrichosporon cavernicola]BEI80313.1 hypothetical protein CcaverHIS002_0108420 [Cutaneotrichosporon cavernicola]BEI88117.1 hypothetical protein CcaverHIS019_0108350 [Cutaneotrichosporon cavernicola]BEI95888.1 hypothetical protein CcaverHIS631_0108370 [Cutaneotrichosporon cavernicola]BEJ03662.1 hypothetical protein CcaverHIS641_0108370 [Cutaneotrichosporon cavernicola]
MSEKTSILDTATLVTIAGRQLETFSLGDGPDLVLFESGGASAGAVWGRVVQSLATDARIVLYNRAGYGRSWAAWDKRTLANLVDDLLHLLETMEYRRLVLVGHSWGGPVIRSVAANLGEKCTGLVLVDATEEGNKEYFGGMEKAFYRNSWMFLPKALWGSLATEKEQQLKSIPEPYRSQAVRDSSSIKAAWTAGYEIANIVPGLRELVASPATLAETTAVTCISGQIPQNKMRTEQNAAHQRRAHLAGQRGKYVPAHKSGHAVHHTEPQLIADEIAAILES